MDTDKAFFEKLNIILSQQIDDIRRAREAHADMLCLVGCLNMIEFLGGLMNGKLGVSSPGVVRERFIAGCKLLSDDWKRGIFSKSRIIFNDADMWDLRNTLTHQFTPKVPKYQAVKVTGTGNKDIMFWYSETQSNGTVDERLIAGIPVMGLELETVDASNKLLSLLNKDIVAKNRANQALSRLPNISFEYWNAGRGVH